MTGQMDDWMDEIIIELDGWVSFLSQALFMYLLISELTDQVGIETDLDYSVGELSRWLFGFQTLHKSASDNEKEEFLKEALLMNNFKHDHILRLLGVSLDHDPQFLILELMDGGDLLTFLRASRPSFVNLTGFLSYLSAYNYKGLRLIILEECVKIILFYIFILYVFHTCIFWLICLKETLVRLT